MKFIATSLVFMSLFILVSCDGDEDSDSFSRTLEIDGSVYTCTTSESFAACIQDGEPTANCDAEASCSCEGECPDLSLEEVLAALCSLDGNLETGESCSIDDVNYNCTSSGLEANGSTFGNGSITIQSIDLSCNAT